VVKLVVVLLLLPIAVFADINGKVIGVADGDTITVDGEIFVIQGEPVRDMSCPPITEPRMI